MSRLSAIKPRIDTLSSRLGSIQPQRVERERDVAAPWRRWYKTARWQKLRLVILMRDSWKCQKTGVLLIGKHRNKDGKPDPNSPVIDHIKPHRGNPELFWDESNLQAVSKEYHDSEKQRLEQESLHQRGVWD